MAGGERGRSPTAFLVAARGDSRGVVGIGVLIAVVMAVVPVLVGAGRVTSVVEGLRSTAWVVGRDGDLVQVSGLTSEQLAYIERDRDAGFGADAQVREDDTLVYVLDDRRLVGLDTTTGEELPGGDVVGDQLLVHEGRTYVIDEEAREVHQIEAGTARAATSAAVPGDGDLGQSALDDHGALWVPVGGRSGVHRYVDGRRISTVEVPGRGRLDVAAVGPRVVAVRPTAGVAREITAGELRPEIRVGGSDVVVPTETLPTDGPLALVHGATVVHVDLTTREVVELDLGDGPLTPPVVTRGRIVVLQETPDGAVLHVVTLRDGRLTTETTPADELDLSRTTVRSRDGIVYVNDPDADVGFVVEGGKVTRGERGPDPELPGRPTVEPGEPPAPLTPPTQADPGTQLPGTPDVGGPDPTGPDPGGTDGPLGGPGGLPGGSGPEDGVRPGTGTRPGAEDPPEVSCDTAARSAAGAAGTLTIADGEVGTRDGTAGYSWPAVPAAVRSACAGATLSVVLDERHTDGSQHSSRRDGLALSATSTTVGFPAAATTVQASHILVPAGGGAAIGLGSSGSVAVPSPEPTAPGQVGGLTGSGEDGTVTLSWAAPAGGADDYGVTIQGVTGGEQRVAATGYQHPQTVAPGTYDVAVRAFLGDLPGPVASVQIVVTAALPTTFSARLSAPSVGPRPQLLVTTTAGGGTTCTIAVTGPGGSEGTRDVGCDTEARIDVQYYGSQYTVAPVAIDGTAVTGPTSNPWETNRASLRITATAPKYSASPGGAQVDYTVVAQDNWFVECLSGSNLLRTFSTSGSFGAAGVPHLSYVPTADFTFIPFQNLRSC